MSFPTTPITLLHASVPSQPSTLNLLLHPPQKQPESAKPLVLYPSRKPFRRWEVSLSSRNESSSKYRRESESCWGLQWCQLWPGVQHDREGQAAVSMTPIKNQRSEEESSTPPDFPYQHPPIHCLHFLSLLMKQGAPRTYPPALTLAWRCHLRHLSLSEVRDVLRAQRVRFGELSSYVLVRKRA